MDPVDVGNGQRVLVTEMAGRASVELKGAELGLDLAGHPDAVSTRGRARSRSGRPQGWSFEAADASLELLMRVGAGRDDGDALPFTLESYRVIIEHRADGEVVSEATVKLVVDGERIIATRRGQRPGQRAGRRAARGARAVAPVAGGRRAVGLQGPHPRAQGAGASGTDAVTRVLVESTDGDGLVDDGRRARQRRRGVLAGAGRRRGVRGAAHGPARRRALTGRPVARTQVGGLAPRAEPGCETPFLGASGLGGARPAPATRRSPTRRPEPRGRPRAAAGPRRGRCRAARRTRAPSTA